MNKEEKAFRRGFAWACALSVNCHHNMGDIVELYGNYFMTIAQLKEAGVDDVFIDSLKPVIKEVQRQKKSDKNFYKVCRTK